MSPRRKLEFPIEVHPEYLAELRRRIETGPGFGPVADAAEMARGTLWRVLNGGDDDRHRITADAVERVRRSLASFDSSAPQMPPPLVPVRSVVHHEWNQIGEALLDADPDIVARAVADPDALAAAVRVLAAQRTRPG